jgi:Fe-S-cluster containining protein
MNVEPPIDPSSYRDDLRAIYDALEAEIAEAGPVCALSGRCCRFEEYGHTLFLSEPELMVLLAGAPPPVRPLDEGQTCPWQDRRGRCTAHEARPLGCRVYFCEDSYQSHAHDLSERYIGRLKRLVESYRLPWNYAPLHLHLRRAREDGRFLDPCSDESADSDVDINPPESRNRRDRGLLS